MNCEFLMSEKAIREQIIDKLLLLYLVDTVNEYGKVEDDLKAQKLVFLAEKSLIQKQLKGFNYDFFRWNKGPFCARLSNDINELLHDDFLDRTPSGMKLSKEGRKLLKQCKPLLNDKDCTPIGYEIRRINESAELINQIRANPPPLPLKHLLPPLIGHHSDMPRHRVDLKLYGDGLVLL